MTKNITAIAKNTFKETIRDKILVSAVLVIIAIILFTLFIGSISLGESTRMIIDFSVTAIYILQMFVAIFIGSMLIYKEIERKTFYLLLPKPITRTEILIGKCIGLTLTTVLVTVLSTLVLYAILFIQSGQLFFVPIALSVFLSTLEAVLLILISMFFSGVTSPVLASIVTIILYFVGHSSTTFHYIFIAAKSAPVELLAKIIYYILPNLEKFNIRNTIVYGDIPSVTTVTAATLYAFSYAILLLLITQIVFKKKDF